MEKITSEEIEQFLYNHHIPKDFNNLMQAFILTELTMEKQMNIEEFRQKIQIYGKSYPIHEVIFTSAEYIKFIILNNSIGNYDIKRGFEFQQEILYDKDGYCLYLKYIFDTMGISLDYQIVKENIEKRRDVHGDVRYTNLIYEFLQDYVFKQAEELYNKGLICADADSIHQTTFSANSYLYEKYKKNGVEAYRDTRDEYKNMYYFLKKLMKFERGKNLNNQVSYNDLWFSTKYIRAKKRNASKEELEEIKSKYNYLVSKNSEINLENIANQFLDIQLEFSE